MKLTAAAFTIALLAASLPAQGALSPLFPRDPVVMGMGGSFVSVAEGSKTLLQNPAGFAGTKLTFGVEDSAWGYVRPSAETLDYLASDPSPVAMISRFMTGNGTGGGDYLSASILGNNIAIAGYGIADTSLYGKNLLGVQGKFDSEIGGVIGLGIPLSLPGLTLRFGGDLRPYYRMTGKIDSRVLGANLAAFMAEDMKAQDLLMELPVYCGYSLAIDLGALASVGPFTFGLSVRDIAAPSDYVRLTLGKALSSVGNPPRDADTAAVWNYPDIAAGVSFHPDMGTLKSLFDPRLHFEIRDPVTVIAEEKSPWGMVHIGADARLLSFLVARAGINAGYLSAGLGLDFVLLKLDAAVFTEETGIRAGDRPRTGVALGARIGL